MTKIVTWDPIQVEICLSLNSYSIWVEHWTIISLAKFLVLPPKSTLCLWFWNLDPRRNKSTSILKHTMNIFIRKYCLLTPDKICFQYFSPSSSSSSPIRSFYTHYAFNFFSQLKEARDNNQCIKMSKISFVTRCPNNYHQDLRLNGT